MSTEFSILFESVRKRYSIFKGKSMVYLVGYDISQDILKELNDNFPEYEFSIADPSSCPNLEEEAVSVLYFYGIGIPIEYENVIKKTDYEIIKHDEIIISTPVKYNDSFGNSVICDCPGYKISIKGGGNKINILNSSKNLTNFQIKLTSFCNIYIGTNTQISNGLIIAEDYSIVKIGNNIRGNLKIATHDHCRISIDENSTVSNTIFDVYSPYSEIIVGKDCMFSEEVECISGDGHPIFDLSTGLPTDRKKSLVIGNHVWVGRRATILNNAKIRDGAIVGACSLVTGSFPNNCIIAGNPAKILRKDISWARALHGEKVEYCNGYICKTGDFEKPNLIKNETIENCSGKLVESRDKGDCLLIFNELLNLIYNNNENPCNDQIKNIINSKSDSFYYAATVAFEQYGRVSNVLSFYSILDTIVDSQKSIDKKVHLSMLASNAYKKGNGVAVDLKKAAV